MPFAVAAAASSRAQPLARRGGPIVFVRGARKNAAVQGDNRKRILQRALYPRNGPRDESPIGTYRPDAKLALRRSIQNVEVHETIERAWLLHQRHQRQARTAELQRKWDSMHAAMSELRSFDYDRFVEVNTVEDPRARPPAEQVLLKNLKGPERQFIEGRIRGLFPREMRIPTNTPSRAGWNHAWRSPLVLMEEARIADLKEREMIARKQEKEKAAKLAAQPAHRTQKPTRKSAPPPPDSTAPSTAETTPQ